MLTCQMVLRSTFKTIFYNYLTVTQVDSHCLIHRPMLRALPMKGASMWNDVITGLQSIWRHTLAI